MNRLHVRVAFWGLLCAGIGGGLTACGQAGGGARRGFARADDDGGTGNDGELCSHRPDPGQP